MSKAMNVYKAYYFLILIVLIAGGMIHVQGQHAELTVSGPDNEFYKEPFAGGMNACQFGEIDINLDGIKDLIVFDRQGNRIMPYINGGTSGQVDYSLALEYRDNFPELKQWAIFTDYNMDGKADIFTYNPQYPGIIVYKNISSTDLRFELVVYPYLTSWYGSGYVNILVTYADYPGISDIDGDGDLDILTFWALGSFVEMHKNLSMEQYGHADSMVFERTTSCWGEFAENEESNELYLDTCFGTKYPEPPSVKERHTGSTLLLTDLNNDNTKDLLLGDVDYPQLIYLLNDGTQEDAHISYYNQAFPNEDYPSWVYSMPAAALIDINNDGVKDLLVSPFDPNPFVTQNHRSVWLYLNEGYDNEPVFTFNNNRFLQQDMIDCGSGAYPVFADINLDGLLDLIIGNYGYYQSSWYDASMALHSEYRSRMAVFMNVGTSDGPRFEFNTDDFGSVHEMNILGAYPAFGDIDTDDDADMIVGRDDGTLMFYRNCSCLGNPEDFELEQTNYMGIDVGEFSAPFLYDIDEDGLIDLIIGEKGGNLNYYKNTGDIYEPAFTFITDSLGKVNVTDPMLSWDGYSTPYIFRGTDGLMRLVSGSEQGVIYYYKNIEGNLTGSFEVSDELWMEIDSNYITFPSSMRTSAAIANLNDDNYLDLMVGNFSGGINFFSTMNTPPVTQNVSEMTEGNIFNMTIFPNPADDIMFITTDLKEKEGPFVLQVVNMTGIKVLEKQYFAQVNYSLHVDNLVEGVYICIIRSGSDYRPKAYSKVIIQH